MSTEGIIFFGQLFDYAGRGIAGARLRTASANENFKIEIVETAEFFDEESIFSVVDSMLPKNIKFVGFSTAWIRMEYGLYTWYNIKFFENFKKRYPDILLITGGQQSFLYKSGILKYSDYHFDGFSDVSFIEFLKKINDKPNNLVFHKSVLSKGYFINSDLSHPVIDPNSLETVFEECDVIEKFQPLPIELSRGCIFRCSFCRHPFQGKKDYDSYQRTPESIANELKRNYESFGTTRYSIMDDTFNDSIEKLDRLERAIEIAKLPNFEFCAYVKPELLVTKPEMIPRLARLGLKGAFMGIESFNNKTRKAIARGVGIERIHEACQRLAQENKNQVLTNAAFIVGLPYESKDDLYKTVDYLIQNRDTFVRSWEFRSLIIRKDTSGQASLESEFDKNPEKYGYTIVPNTFTWANEHFNNNTAQEFAQELTDMSKNHLKLGGWSVASAWQINKSEDYIQNAILNYDILGKELIEYKKCRYINDLKRFKE